MSADDTLTTGTNDSVASPIVAVPWLRDHRADASVLVIDVRDSDAYNAGHIPGAVHLDLSLNRLASSRSEAIEQWIDALQRTIRRIGIRPDHHVVFYEDVSGTMAAYGVWLLDAAGLRNGAMLNGGFAGWIREGGETSTDAAMPVPSETSIRFDPRVLATADQILGDLKAGSTGAKRVDARATSEVARGAIPGSIHLDWHDHLDGQGAFRPMEELAQTYQSLGLAKDDRVASYCAGGIRAANTYVVLKALGYEDVQNYAPSWGEWGSRSDTPVE